MRIIAHQPHVMNSILMKGGTHIIMAVDTNGMHAIVQHTCQKLGMVLVGRAAIG